MLVTVDVFSSGGEGGAEVEVALGAAPDDRGRAGKRVLIFVFGFLYVLSLSECYKMEEKNARRTMESLDIIVCNMRFRTLLGSGFYSEYKFHCSVPCIN